MRVLEEKRNEAAILSYLKENDSYFKPPLSSRVALKKYAQKLYANSVQLWLEMEGETAGFCAIYVNNDFVYISTISVKNIYRGLGGGLMLLTKLKELATIRKIGEIRLEIQIENKDVLSFYTNFGFKKMKIEGFLYMKV